VRVRGEHAAGLSRRSRAVAHVDDPDRAAAYLRLLADDCPTYSNLSEAEQRYARMLFFSMWPDGGGFSSYDAGLSALREEQAARDALMDIVHLALDAAAHVTMPPTGP